MTFDKLMKIAGEELDVADTAPERLPEPLVYVLETAGGTIHTVRNDDFQETLAVLARTKDTAVSKVLSVWKCGAVDVPSYAFRKALLALDAANAQTQILMLTEGGYAFKRMALLM